MSDADYSEFAKLDPFFTIIRKGLEGLVDGAHFWDLIDDTAVFEFRYDFPGWPRRLDGREAIMKTFSGYGMDLHRADSLVVHHGRDPRIVVLEYEIHGTVPATGKPYDNRFASIITVENRKVVHWRDYMDSLAVVTATTPP
jgi:uncharacterized protein